MARPKRPFSGVEDIAQMAVEWMQDEKPGTLGVRQRIRWESSRHWHYRTPNGQFDPLTHLYVLDAVAHIHPDIELRSNKLAIHMNETNEAFVFDPVTVGKVLSDLCDAFEDVLGAKNGLLERGRDWKGTFYVLHRNPETAKAYWKAREDLMRLSQLEMEARAEGRKIDRLASPLLECPSLRGEWVDGPED
jgi:hypothetical protein